MATTRETLEQAHALIQQQKYREARQLLQPITDHPTAAKWIARIDELTVKSAGSQPSSPAAAKAPRPARQPAQKPKSVDDLFEEQPNRPAPWLESMTAASTAKPARKSAVRSSGEGAISLVYTLFGMGVVVVLIFAFARETIIELFNPMVTFSHERFTLNHGSVWEPQPLTNHGYCRDTFDECLVFLVTSPNVGFLVDYVPNTSRYSSRELAENERYYGETSEMFPEYEHEFQDLTVGGLPAVALKFRVVELDDNGGEYYKVDILIADGLDSYLINLNANTACTLNRRIDDINAMLSSLRFRTANFPTAEDGYTEATPAALTIPACSS